MPRPPGQHQIRDTRITGNTVPIDGLAGGVLVGAGPVGLNVDIDSVLIAGNATGSAGGMGVLVSGSGATVNITNATIAGNTGSGSFSSGVRFDNSAGGGSVVNTIIYDNENGDTSPGVTTSLSAVAAPIIADRCLIEFFPAASGTAPFANTDCSSADPLFVNTSTYAIGAGSPAIDAGDNNAISGFVTQDILNQPRFRDDTGTADTGEGLPGEPIIDIGAVEFQGTTTPDCLADTNGDGNLTPGDFNAWVLAFNNQAPACDQNGDGACLPNDFNAWILNFNAGC